MPFVDYKPFDEDKRCTNPEHNPPSMIVLPPGVHTYECPACGQKHKIIIQPPPRLDDAWEVGSTHNPKTILNVADT